MVDGIPVTDPFIFTKRTYHWNHTNNWKPYYSPLFHRFFHHIFTILFHSKSVCSPRICWRVKDHDAAGDVQRSMADAAASRSEPDRGTGEPGNRTRLETHLKNSRRSVGFHHQQWGSNMIQRCFYVWTEGVVVEFEWLTPWRSRIWVIFCWSENMLDWPAVFAWGVEEAVIFLRFGDVPTWWCGDRVASNCWVEPSRTWYYDLCDLWFGWWFQEHCKHIPH